MMPPKTVGKKSAKGKSADKRTPDERLKDQLEEDIVLLQEEVLRERREKSHFQLERDGSQRGWEESRRRLEEEEAELRRRRREREEAEHRHREEITAYGQKLKRVLSEHHGAATALKAASVTSATSATSAGPLRAELERRREALRLQAALRERAQHGEEELAELQQEQQAELLELEKRCRERVQVMVTKRETSEESVLAARGQEQQRAVQQVERRMRDRVDAVVEQHDRALLHLNSHGSTQRRLLDEQHRLKLNLAEEMKLKVRVEKQMSKVEQENQRLKEALAEGQRKLSESREHLEAQQQACAKGPANPPARVKALALAHQDLSVSFVMLEQAVEKREREMEERSRLQTAALLEAEQEAGLKHLVLQRKVEALSRVAERKEAELWAALCASNVDQSAAGAADDKLQEKLRSKQATVSGLQRELDGDRQEYDDLLQTCRDRLAASGVPLHDFPFQSSKWILGGRT